MTDALHLKFASFALLAACASAPVVAQQVLLDTDGHHITLKAGHTSLSKWLLPAQPPAPADNQTTPERVKLGEMLFFDPRLSGTGQVTCVSCHFPERGWSDGMPTSVRFMGEVMNVASPTIVNIGYNSIFMWDGRQPTLERQAIGGQGIKADINAGMAEFGIKDGVHLERLKQVQGYLALFEQAYPGQGISRETIGKAIAAFERSVVSNTSPFDRWIKGDEKAMNAQQIRGFASFIDPEKGNCGVCHWAPNFTDNGFHNVGLQSYAVEKPDLGRYKQRPVRLMRGAFKTPTLRDIALTAPYFHDGSARLLRDVVDHYARGGIVHDNLSPNLKPLALTDEDKDDLVAFMQALTSPQPPYVYPVLPK
jgi:cytochrome c peroxidase